MIGGGPGRPSLWGAALDKYFETECAMILSNDESVIMRGIDRFCGVVTLCRIFKLIAGQSQQNVK